MDYLEWKEQITESVEDLKEIDFGYPQSENIVRSAPEERDCELVLRSSGITSRGLAGLYSVCDGVSLPDVRNGYFIKSLSDLVTGFQAREPKRIEGEIQGDIVVFGSDGGGNRFSTFLDTGEVLILGLGTIENQVFRANRNSARFSASSVEGFLQRLLEDVQAFITGNEAHKFIS